MHCRALRWRLAQHAPLSAREEPLRQRSAPRGGLVVVVAAGAADAVEAAAVAELPEEEAQELARLDSCRPRKGGPRPRKGGNSNSRSGGSLHDSRATRARVGAATRGERGAVERVRAQAARLGRDRHPLGRLLAMRGHQAVQVAVSRGTEVSEGRRRCVQAEVERVRGGGLRAPPGAKAVAEAGPWCAKARPPRNPERRSRPRPPMNHSKLTEY